MKLAAIAVVASLGLGGAARADRAGAPDVPPPDAALDATAPPPGAGHRGNGEFRELLIERFDRNHDGVLQPDERRRAIHALRTLARRMASEELRRQAREARTRNRTGGSDAAADPATLPRGLARTLRRLDTNHDGQIGPDEMPPGLARRLRRFDRNGDGVLSPDELPAVLGGSWLPAERGGAGANL